MGQQNGRRLAGVTLSLSLCVVGSKQEGTEADGEREQEGEIGS